MGSYQGASAPPPTALLLVPPQSGSPTWGKGAVAASSAPQQVLPREVTHVRPRSHIPLLRADDTWGRVPSHILINLRILGPSRREPGQIPQPRLQRQRGSIPIMEKELPEKQRKERYKLHGSGKTNFFLTQNSLVFQFGSTPHKFTAETNLTTSNEKDT